MGVFNPTDDSGDIERYATSIVSVVDASQLARFGDSDLGAVLGRISGLAVTEDKDDAKTLASQLLGVFQRNTR
jgi:hypothetical protein